MQTNQWFKKGERKRLHGYGAEIRVSGEFAAPALDRAEAVAKRHSSHLDGVGVDFGLQLVGGALGISDEFIPRLHRLEQPEIAVCIAPELLGVLAANTRGLYKTDTGGR